MFGDKQAEIGRLQGELAAAQQELDEVRPYADIAKEIHGKVVGKLLLMGTEPQTDFTVAYSHAVQETTIETRRDTINAVFDSLPPTERWKILQASYPEDELQAALAGAHKRELALLRDTTNELKRVARKEHRLDTSLFTPGQKISILLCANEVQRGYYRTHKNISGMDAHRIINATATDDTGVLHILEDKWYRRERMKELNIPLEQLPVNTLVRLGTVNPQTKLYDPSIYFDTVAGFAIIGGDPIITQLDLAAVTVNKKNLLPR